ncbi:MAG: winged helix-turn-helix domain-containing protein [Lysobacterales bacterium]
MTDVNPFDHSSIDDVIHGRLRLGIMGYLSASSPALFTELRDQVGATDGNLSTHLKKLESAGYVFIEKRFAGRKPQTMIHLTRPGRAAWVSWLERVQSLIDASSVLSKQ